MGVNDGLLPCPWCGGRGEAWEDRAVWGDKKYGETISVVFCDGCGREVAGCSWNVASAVDAWNKLPRAEKNRLSAAITASGIPDQARLDDKGPPLRITVERAREIMGMVEEGKCNNT